MVHVHFILIFSLNIVIYRAIKIESLDFDFKISRLSLWANTASKMKLSASESVAL